jgi:CHAT domain-containing protein/tetratricopeptide (TPR) repeat protein
LADLENAISNIQKAVNLTHDGHPSKPMYLLNLGSSQHSRFGRLGELADLNSAISNTQMGVDLTDDGHPHKPIYFSNLGNGQETRFARLGELADLENAISNTQKAVELTDDGHPDKPSHLSNLGISQQARFGRLGELADLENAISNLQKTVDLTDDRHPFKPGHLSNLGSCQQSRFERLGELADLENSISNKQKAIDLTHDGHPDKPTYIFNLGSSQHSRFGRLEELADLENAISNTQMTVDLTDDGDPDKPNYFSTLGSAQATRFGRLGELTDLENAISNTQKAVELTDDRHPQKPIYLSRLALSQKIRFGRLGELADINSAIFHTKIALDLTPVGDAGRSNCLLLLGICHESHFRSLKDKSNLVAAISAFKEAASLNTAYPSTALKAARRWADLSRRGGDLLVALQGYRTALEILPRVAWLGLDAFSRHDQLLEIQSENLGCQAATCAIQLGRLDEAVELLDLGRSVYWQQASSLRSDLGALKLEDKALAKDLETIGRQLDTGNFSDPTFTGERQGRVNTSEDVGRQRRDLVREWEKLVERVRELPGFRYFLKATPVHQLRQAATAGQVIIINISNLGADALTFKRTGPIEHIQLPAINLDKITEIAGKVMLNRSAEARSTTGIRKMRRVSNTQNLRNTLSVIWHKVLVPVFRKIQIPLESNPDLPQHRIWWYLTGPLTFIPIHAAGPEKGAIDVSRIVVSSYVTTLDSLFKAQQKFARGSAGSRRLMAISQPNTPGQNPIPQCTQEVQSVIKGVTSVGWVLEDIVALYGSDATVERVSTALDTCSWAHFACHGSQDPVFGMKSAFALHDGHLELSQIASKQLSVGQFAFLSACYAASGLKELPGEAMHLAAGLQFAGFPSVIATMWAIRDEDAPKIADHTYRYLLRNGMQGLDPSDAAMALNRAVLALREDPDVTIDRWAPFIHFGI